MIGLKEFHQDFIQSVLADSENRGLLKSQAFFENVCDELVSSGDLTVNHTAAEYIKQGIEVQGFDYDEERRMLTLLVHEFFQDDDMHTLTKSVIETKFRRLKGYFASCIGELYHQLEETSDAFSMSYTIYHLFVNNQIDRMRFLILTDGKATKNLRDTPREVLSGIVTEFRVIDIVYIHNIFLSEFNELAFELALDLPCLEIPVESDKYQSYLTFLNGNTIFAIYEEFGQKLFEQNVRTFLQFKGGVNKGIRNTIEYSPEMFFAYNNGITATAASVEFGEDGRIKKIVDFQIVNGGQTTSAIYAAKKISKLDVSNICVQMKLSVVSDREKMGEYVSKISEYANTQNKVNKSDFFSNSPFHQEMKSYSRRIWAPAVGGGQRRAHWFYERVRGEYLNEQVYLSNSEKRKFQLENPKQQLLDKTFLSKSENSWLQRPYVVSKGAQYSFSAFADYITEWLEKDQMAITEAYFRDAISRIILFRTVERIVSNADWYDNGFRAQTVTYAIAYLSHLIESTGKLLNFNKIWEDQEVPVELVGILKVISESVYHVITNPPSGSANAAQWCKKPACWTAVQQIRVKALSIPASLLVDLAEEKDARRADRKDKQLDSGIEIQTFVVSQSTTVWRALNDYFRRPENRSHVTPAQLDILDKMTNGRLVPPSEKQSKILYQLYERASEENVTA